ncbi:MAG: FAD-dependent oxidoreductase [Deltaproteobacteria bacterium]|nr:FAD-dependent oxidoreductase [Deltaproteobacteria bacterium]
MAQNIVIIGAVALGPKAACRLKRLEPESHVVLIDQSDLISYGGCGIPYFISGDVSDPGQLRSTSFNMLRDEKFFEDAKDIQTMTHTKATSIDPMGKKVHVKHMQSGEESVLPYDKLVLATGSRPKRLSIPGSDLEGVFTVSNMDDAIAIKEKVAGGQVGKACIIGGGAIGLEMAEALSDLWGIDTSVVEFKDQILPGILSSKMAHMAQMHMAENGVSFYFSERVVSLSGDGMIRSVATEKREIEADLVIMSVGVDPNGELAKAAGLATSESGAVIVDKTMRTSNPHIFAGGDCVEIQNLVTGKPGYFPSGSLANRQGRVIGTNLAGGDMDFDGAVGSFVVKLFDISLASAGLCLDAAQREGFDAVSAFVAQFDRAHFYPEKEIMYLELVVERGSKRILGIQGLGDKGDGMVGRINAVASILKSRPTTEEISNMELAYSPPFTAAMDILNALGNTADNILNGMNRVVDVEEFSDMWNEKEREETYFLDCRGWGNAEPFVTKYPLHWKSIPQDELRTRLAEVPKDKRIVLICNTGVRSYEAQITLDQMGIKNTLNLQGGVAALKKWGADL